MRKRRFSITERQAESLCEALSIAKSYAKEAIERNQELHKQFWTLREKEWKNLQENLENYKWEVE